MKNKKIYLSLIVPIFNEEKRIHKLQEIGDYLKKTKLNYELIVVNDGSRDRTGSILNTLSQKIPLKIISYRKNRGKGYAVRKGMIEARGIFRIFIDIDLSTPIETCDIFIKKASKYPIIIGNRKHSKSNILIHQPKIRELMGKAYTSFSNFILGLNVSDLTCGMKGFSEEAAKEIFTKTAIDRWGFDAELIFIAKLYSYPILEVPVKWSHESETKVRLPGDAISSITELIRIRMNQLKKAYEPMKS